MNKPTVRSVEIRELKKTPGNGNKGPLIPQPIEGSSVDALCKGFMGTNKPTVFSYNLYGSMSC